MKKLPHFDAADRDDPVTDITEDAAARTSLRAARHRRHPAIVSRLRLAQRFGRRELKDVPHA